MTVQISREEFEKILEKKLYEVLVKVMLNFVPHVSKEEQEELEEVLDKLKEGEYEE